MKGYTKIPNDMLNPSQLSIEARYLYCVLLRYCGKDEWCYPSQKKIGDDLGITERHIRNLLNELNSAGLMEKKRRGWNRSNTYHITKYLKTERNGISYHLGNLVPFHNGNSVPANSTYLKGKDKRSIKGLELLRNTLISKRIYKK